MFQSRFEEIVNDRKYEGRIWQNLERGKNADFWIKKISKNQQRDEEVNKQLQYLGWTVIRFWGKDITKHTDECVQVIEETIFDIMMGTDNYYELV